MRWIRPALLALTLGLCPACRQTPTTTAPVMGAPQVADAVLAIHQAEIDQAALVEQRATTRQVRAFAKEVEQRETALREGLGTFLRAQHITPLSSSTGEELRRASNIERATLMETPGIALDRAYLQQEVRRCEEQLNRAELEFVPYAGVEIMRRRIDLVTRPSIQWRLDSARRLDHVLVAADAPP